MSRVALGLTHRAADSGAQPLGQRAADVALLMLAQVDGAFAARDFIEVLRSFRRAHASALMPGWWKR